MFAPDEGSGRSNQGVFTIPRIDLLAESLVRHKNSVFNKLEDLREAGASTSIGG